jgi:hypothetical protein
MRLLLFFKPLLGAMAKSNETSDNWPAGIVSVFVIKIDNSISRFMPHNSECQLN